MDFEVRPFELLKLIRDGVITNVRDLRIPPSAFYLDVDRLLEALERIGWIEITIIGGDIKPTEHMFEVQKALEVSLTQLSPFGHSSVVTNPVFGRPKVPSKPKDLFVLMPFSNDMRAVYDDHIRAVAKRIGVTAARADDFFSADSIVSEVWGAIAAAKVLIADCTGQNANVFYELGIAHALGKSVVLTSQKKEDIPFDIQFLRTILYEFTPRGMFEFEASLEATLTNELERLHTLSDVVAWWKTRGV